MRTSAVKGVLEEGTVGKMDHLVADVDGLDAGIRSAENLCFLSHIFIAPFFFFYFPWLNFCFKEIL